MRVLGIDFGGTRIGIAVVETATKLPSPRQCLAASGTLAKDALAIQKIMADECAELVVVGLPLDQGSETKMSRICRMLVDRLRDLGARVETVDESMTSNEAELVMLASGMKASQVRKAVDGEAACRILERFMECNGQEG